MTNQQIIDTLNGITTIIQRKDVLPYAVRRAIRKNYRTLLDEYNIFDEARNTLESTTKNERDEKIKEMLNTNVDLEIIYIEEGQLDGCPFSVVDEMALEFMIKEA